MDTDGLDGLHGVLISHGAHAPAAPVLIRLQLSLNHVSCNAEDLFYLRLGRLVVQLQPPHVSINNR